MSAKSIVVLIIAFLLLIVILQNTQVVTFRLFFWKIGMSRIILLVLTLVVGFALGYTIAGFGQRKRQGN
jgi:uncharacterized integral membrane protein